MTRIVPDAPFLKRVYVASERVSAYEEFPYGLPFVRDFDLSFKSAVTFLVGENGSGKSTLIEAMAEACGLPVSGGGRNEAADRHGPEHHSAEWPAWHLAPLVSVWAIESKKRPDWVGWWVICGDLPTDYIAAAKIKHPREAVRSIAKEWHDQARLMTTQDRPDDIRIGRPEDWASLAPLLEARARLLTDLADDDSIWEGVDAR